MNRHIHAAALVVVIHSSLGCSLIYDFEKDSSAAGGADAAGRGGQGGKEGTSGSAAVAGGTKAGGETAGVAGSSASTPTSLAGGVAGGGASGSAERGGGGNGGIAQADSTAGSTWGGTSAGGDSTLAGSGGRTSIESGGMAGAGAGAGAAQDGGTSGEAGNTAGGISTTGGTATGGVAGSSTVATGGSISTGGVATGGVATGGVATGGVATGGVATGGAATGGSTVIPPTGRPFVPVTNSCQGLTTTCQGESCCTAIAMPGGSYPMGASADPSGSDYDPTPSGDVFEHQATVASFAMDKYEVTVGRFRMFVAAYNSWHVTSGNPTVGAGQHPIASNTGWEYSWQSSSYTLPENVDILTNRLKCDSAAQTWNDLLGTDEEEAYPVNCVDWYTAFAFCIWDSGRLPTEAEWEYAAAGGVQNRLYPWGSASPTASRANYEDSNNTPLVVVGSKPAGAGYFGHLDLAGSVEEWNFDWYNATWYGSASAANPCVNCANTSSTTQRAVRGGSFVTPATLLRSTYRVSSYPTYYRRITGFRCARNP